MRYMAWVFVVLLSWSVSAFAEDRPQVDKYIKAYTGGEGITVWLLGIGKPEDKEFLLQFAGVNHDWDQKIFKVKRHDLDNDGRKFEYVMPYNNGDYRPLQVRGGSYQIYLPKGENGTHVSYNEGVSRSGNAQHFLTDYLRQEGKIKN